MAWQHRQVRSGNPGGGEGWSMNFTLALGMCIGVLALAYWVLTDRNRKRDDAYRKRLDAVLSRVDYAGRRADSSKTIS
jgi:hypothetical protein